MGTGLSGEEWNVVERGGTAAQFFYYFFLWVPH